MEERHNNAFNKVEAIMNGENNSVEKNTNESIDKGRKRAIKKAEKQRRKMAKIREKNKRLADALEEKARVKAEKRESKERIKQEKINLKKEKEKNRKESKNYRIKNRQKNREQGRNFGGWLAAVISLGVITLALTGTLTYFLVTPSIEASMLESAYKKSLYETVEQVDNIDLNLSKTLATSDTVAMQKYLVDTAINSELCESQLQQLPIKDENKFYTTKLINQIGDFSKYLNNKLARGESLTEEDLSGLFSLYQANRNLKDALSRALNDMDGDFSYLDIGKEISGNYLLKNFTELENLSVEYPELIYDGPFSDGIDRAEIKGLSGGEITPEVAREIFRASFAKFSLEEDPISDGETNGDIECYNVYSSVKGENLYAQVSKVGGKIIMFSYAGSCLSTDINKEFAIEKAKEFLESQDIFGMTPVWINLSNNVYTINFAFEDNGVIVYSDLVKIRVCAETAMVIGLEATEYYTNHTERIIPSPTLTKESAMEKVSSNIEILTSRLALVPVGRSGERLCYEFSGEYDGSTFYAYIDAETGRQVELFKVIKAGEGELLM